jgi:protein-disulfide isomerase
MTKTHAIQKGALILLGSFLLLFLGGCEDKDDKKKEEKEKTEKSENTSHNAAGNEDLDAQIQAGIEKYISENQVEFGKQVINSANAYQEFEKTESLKKVAYIREGENILGNKEANIVLFEYSDYHCPYCSRFHTVTHQLVENNTDLAVILRPLPFHPSATPLHEIAECVGANAGNDAFWKFSDSVFEKGSKGITTENYTDELKTLKINKVNEIKTCYESGKMKEKVSASLTEGKTLQIQGTPNSIITNLTTGEIKVVPGAYPLESVQSMIDELK